MLQMALENEIQEYYIDAHSLLVDENGKRVIVRNGYLPERAITSGIGAINIKQPRVRIRNKDLKAYDHFIKTFDAKHPKAVKTLTKDKDNLFNFYGFPAEHWIHIRTTNPIESTFTTVRLRTAKTRGSGSRTAAFTMVFKLALEAEKTWHKLKGYKLIPLVLEGKKFIDGELDKRAA